VSAENSSRTLAWTTRAGYLGCAAVFVDAYTAMTRWINPGMAAFTHDAAPFPFRYRILVPSLARLIADGTGLPLAYVYFAIAVFAVFGILLAFDLLLASFVRRDAARVLAFGILYPLSWNYLGLNRMYFPFDLPGVALFTLGLVFLVRRSWLLYYPLFVLATINRETTWLLTLILIVTAWGRMPRSALVRHVLAQGLLWVGVKAGLAAMYPGGPQFANMAAQNLSTWRGMFTLSGNGAKDWAKLVLLFGGMAWLLPFVLRQAPRFFRRAWLVFPLFLLPMLLVGTIDEARLYAEWIPLAAAPVLLALARLLGEPLTTT